jgi:hypothetical protein
MHGCKKHVSTFLINKDSGLRKAEYIYIYIYIYIYDRFIWGGIYMNIHRRQKLRWTI